MEFFWRQMTVHDMDCVMALSEAAHPALPERREVQLARLANFPQGCLVLGRDSIIQGYAFSHPILPDTPPRLDTAPPVPGRDTTHFYLHDFVVAAGLRGGGYARRGVQALLELGRHYEAVSLISVYGTAPFWSRFGFQVRDEIDADELISYGPDAVLMSRTGRSGCAEGG